MIRWLLAHLRREQYGDYQEIAVVQSKRTPEEYIEAALIELGEET